MSKELLKEMPANADVELFDISCFDLSDAAEGGVWKTYTAPNGKSFECLVGYAGTDKVKTVMSRLLDKHAKKGKISSDAMNDYENDVNRAKARYVLLSVRGLGSKGSPLVYTEDIGFRLLRHPDFRAWISAVSSDHDNFTVAALDLGK